MTHGKNISYDLEDPDLPEISKWLTANPNRINLARIGLRYKNQTLAKSFIKRPRQELHLWDGVITSEFEVDGEKVSVITQGDFRSDAVTFQIKSTLISSGTLEVEMDFPYPPIHNVTGTWDFETFVGSYDFPLNHTTSIVSYSDKHGEAHIRHDLDETTYFANLRWPANSSAALTRQEPEGSNTTTAHRYTLSKTASVGTQDDMLSFTAQFSPGQERAALPSSIRTRNTVDWNNY